MSERPDPLGAWPAFARAVWRRRRVSVELAPLGEGVVVWLRLHAGRLPGGES